MIDPKEQKVVKDLNKVDYVPFPYEMVARVDRIVAMAKSSQGSVQSDADLKAVRMIFDLFVHYYPQAADDLYAAVRHYKSMENDGGLGKEGSAMLQHQIEIPQRFYELMKAVYPNQKWDRKFIKKLVGVIPEVKATKGGI